jgi:protein-L-isoaspartate(D-aspartate) O-methyltransferase
MKLATRVAVVACLVSLTPALPGELSAQSDPYLQQRLQMVEQQIERRGVKRPSVVEAMKQVPRHLFLPEALRDYAYSDGPQPIGDGQTISQPYIVALMTELLELSGDERVLEIGTGSGYQAAVLAQLTEEVYTIEIREKLGEQARRTLESLGYANIEYRIGDGYAGWPEEAPFDAIIVTAAPEEVPQTLIEQLKVGGRMVVPVGRYFQDLQVITRTADGVRTEDAGGVRFVPMIKEKD